MTLRRQLLLVSLLLLSLPWTGCQFIREMEGALRTGQAQSLQATASAVAAVLGQQPDLLYPFAGRREAGGERRDAIYALAAPGPVIVDGYADGWDEVTGITYQGGTGRTPLTINCRAQTRNGYLYLLFTVQDPEVVYHNPGLSSEPNGDRLVLRLWRDNRRQEYVIATAAPGSIRARPGNRRHRGIDPGRVRGYWQDAVGGYSIELEVPLSYTGGRLGFYLVDADRLGGNETAVVGNVRRLDATPPPWLIHSPQQLHRTLAPFSAQGAHIQVIDRQHWLIADLPAAPREAAQGEQTFWLLRLLYRTILSQRTLATPPQPPSPGKLRGEEIDAALAGNAANRRYRDPRYQTRSILSAAVPIADPQGVMGVVLARQSAETYLSLTDQAFSRLLGYSLLALAAAALGLLAYASVLSWRIRRLSLAAREAVSEDGRVSGQFPRSRARDEIGELSRHYADLLERLREYNDYLRSLSRKLSHELRTPIAVIRSSLDNLEQAGEAGDDDAVYLRRARQGLQRLQHILNAMSEANRLDESIRFQEPAPLDLVPLLEEVFAAYRGIYPHHELRLDLQPERAMIQGVPELLVQALDKLMDNAASFCPPGGTIELQLAASATGWLLRLANAGPCLPPDGGERLFEPMVSLRQDSGEEVHLGLGLHIVRLVVEFHRGSVRAENLPDGNGVAVLIELPAGEAAASRTRTPAA